MSKTNHRVNKDRHEKLGESMSHKRRRNFKIQSANLVDMYLDGDVDPDELLDEVDWETHEKLRKEYD